MTQTELTAAADHGLGMTARRDAWWLQPLLIFIGLTTFGVYAIWAAWQGNNYLYVGHGAYYLSPFYSPDLQAIFGFQPPFSFAFLVLWIPLGFRASCYYYRKAYYRSYMLDPPACAVGEPKNRCYQGERKFPFILQNLHRYFFYLALLLLVSLWYDAIRALFFRGPNGGLQLGLGVGTLVLFFNVITLTAFSFGCNSCRHLIGGQLNCFSCSCTTRTRYKLWRGVSVLNLKHMEWAWVSLFAVGFADLYIRLCAMGIWHDVRLW